MNIEYYHSFPDHLITFNNQEGKTKTIRFYNGNYYSYQGISERSLNWHEPEKWKRLSYVVYLVAKAVIVYPLFYLYYYREIHEAILSLKLRRSLIYVLEPSWQKLDISVKPNYLSHYTIEGDETIAKYRNELGLESALEIHQDPLITKEFIHQDFHINKQYPWAARMAGVAFMAAYLQAKRKDNCESLNELYICETIRVFRNKLEEIRNSTKDCRIALIVPAQTYGPFIHKQQVLHKVAVCIEKVKDSLKIVSLDSSPRVEENIIFRHQIIQCSAVQLWSLANFDSNLAFIGQPEVIPWCLFHANLNWDKTQLYFSTVERELIEGCETFALKDAVAFLDNKAFFQEITSEEESLKLQDSTITYRTITALSPEFMKGAQNQKNIEKYIEGNPNLAHRMMTHRKKARYQNPWSLRECVNNHLVKVGEKSQNHLISRRGHKYILIRAEALKSMSDMELKNIISSKLIRDSFYPKNENEHFESKDVLKFLQKGESEKKLNSCLVERLNSKGNELGIVISEI